MANNLTELEQQVKDENVKPETGNQTEKMEAEVKKEGAVKKMAKKAWNYVVTFPKKHPVITSTIVSMSAMTLGVMIADKEKENKRANYPTLPLNNNPIDTTFHTVSDQLPEPDTNDLYVELEVEVDTASQAMDNPEIMTF